MASYDYHFVTRWRVPASSRAVYDLLSDVEGVSRWWPSLYRRVRIVEPGGMGGIGKVVEVESRGFLPYTLHWSFRVTESAEPHGFALDAWGELIGRGAWSFRQEGTDTEITYDWNVRAAKPLLRLLSPVLRPIFAFNHNWVMRRGEEGLRAELQHLQRLS